MALGPGSVALIYIVRRDAESIMHQSTTPALSVGSEDESCDVAAAAVVGVGECLLHLQLRCGARTEGEGHQGGSMADTVQEGCVREVFCY